MSRELTLKELGPPLNDSCDISGTDRDCAAKFYDFFLSSLAQLLRPNSRHTGIASRRHVTFNETMSCRKWLIFILCVQSQWEMKFIKG